MKSFTKLFFATIKTFYRDKLLIFFTLLFPLILGIIFGAVFGAEGESYSAKVGFLSQDRVLKTVLSEKKDVEMVEFENEEDLKKAVAEGEVPLGLRLKNNTLFAYFNKVKVLADPYIRNLPDEIRGKLATPKGFENFGIKVAEVEVQSGRTKATTNSFLIPGLIAVSIFTSGVFSAIELFSRYKEKLILKRLHVTSLNPYTFIISSLLGRITVSIASAFILYAVMIIMFKTKFLINWPLFILSILIGSLFMLSFGTLISLITPSSSAATNFATIIMTIMFFFAGVYFPLEFLPSYLQTIGKTLPLYHLAVTMRMAMGVDKVLWRYLYTEFSLILLAFLLFTTLAAKLIFKRD
jgi:ABC-2 type transport system permease protein